MKTYIIAFFSKIPKTSFNFRPRLVKTAYFYTSALTLRTLIESSFLDATELFFTLDTDPRKFSFGCKQEVHFLHDCQRRDRCSWFFHYVGDIGGAASFNLSNEGQDNDDPGHEVVA